MGGIGSGRPGSWRLLVALSSGSQSGDALASRIKQLSDVDSLSALDSLRNCSHGERDKGRFFVPQCRVPSVLILNGNPDQPQSLSKRISKRYAKALQFPRLAGLDPVRAKNGVQQPKFTLDCFVMVPGGIIVVVPYPRLRFSTRATSSGASAPIFCSMPLLLRAPQSLSPLIVGHVPGG
jgi:hypothetical protein